MTNTDLMPGVLLLCYLIGSIPVAWLLAKGVTGRDLRQVGSGNLGVTNVALSVGRWAGLIVFLSEAAKGILAVLLVRLAGGNELAVALGTLACVVGTRWSIWLKGAGGRGNTAGVSALFLINWLIPFAMLLVWVLLRIVTRSSFWATRIGLLTWPLIFGLVTLTWWYVIFGAAMSLIYLDAQRVETDDHLIIKERWPNLWSFLTGPRRAKKDPEGDDRSDPVS